jgi:hypothetical protein
MHEAGHITNGDLQQDTDAPHGLDAKAEARADLWEIKKMVEHNVFSPPEMLPYFLRIIIINVRYYDEYEPGKGPYKPSDSTMERLKSFNEYLEELSRLPVNNEKHRQQKNELIYLIKMQ